VNSTQRVVTFGPVEASAQEQLDRCLERGGDESRGVLCADHHKGYSMPIGGVLASQSVVMPAGVGYDIACGNYAVKTNLYAPDTHSDVSRLMDEIWSVISFGVGRKNGEPVTDHPVFDQIAKSPVGEQRGLLDLAKAQLGTVGSGNHYVDLFEDRADGALWVGVHFGSRGFGHKTACGFLALAEGKAWGEKTDDSMDAPPTTIPLHTPLADDYLAAMEIAGSYAYAGRSWVVERVLRILGARAEFRVHNHHNFAWWEKHDGEEWLVVRKGATPARPGQAGFVGGSMGDDAVIVVGKDSEQSRAALYSTVHGAGRIMGRMQAKGKWKRGECIRPGLVDWPAWQSKLKAQGVEIRGGGADESPECYKRLTDVLAYHGDTIDVLHTLRPIGVAMAGHEVFDPYKD
jgi:tRNA-splicing ligase RtcB